jgi:signal transduction histidine kinase
MAEPLTAETTQRQPSTAIEFLEDPSLALRLVDVQAMGSQFRPWRSVEAVPNFGYTSSAYWLRLPLSRTSTAPTDWLIEIPYAQLDQVDFYSSHRSPVLTGSSRPLSTRHDFNRFFVFPLHVGLEPDYVYVRVTSSYALTVPLTVWRPDAFSQHVQSTNMLHFMYFGGLSVLSLYGLILFMALRDRRFLVYGLYTLTIGLAIFAGNGFGRLLLWPSSPDFDEVAQSGFLSLGAFFSTMFARKLLDGPGVTLWLIRAMRLIEWLFALIFVLAAFHLLVPVMLRPSMQLLSFNVLLMGLLVSLASFRAYRRQQPGIRFFFWGWVSLWLGASVAVLRAFGLLPSNGLTLYAFQIATIFEVLLFAMAMAEQYRLVTEARHQAQEKALAANQQLLKMTQVSEADLKQAVATRTEQLESALATETLLREQYVRFGAMVAHEFRTPLGIIQSQMSLMRKEIEHGVDQVEHRMHAVQSATGRLALMFDRWLDSAAMIQSSASLKPQPLIVESWLQVQMQSLGHLLTNHQLHLRLNTQEATIAMVDDYHLGVALSNLIDNASKYSPPASKLTVEVLYKPGYVGIAVQDQGAGIPAESHAHVFAEFSRLTPEGGIPGVGLGLSIVQRIAMAHGGHVTLDSAQNAGAIFCIWLQLAQSQN